MQDLSERMINAETARLNAQAPLLAGSAEQQLVGDRLKLLIERIERLEEEKAGIADDIKEVYGEGKSAGFDPKIMRQVVRLRKMATDQRREQEELLDLYKSAIGMA
jgi:uncharacterized protein (UPF0335 family)